MSQAVTTPAARPMTRTLRRLKVVGLRRFYARPGTSICMTRSAGTVALPIDPTDRAIFYNRSTPRTGHSGGLICVTAFRLMNMRYKMQVTGSCVSWVEAVQMVATVDENTR